MKAYNHTKKIRRNFEDNHVPKGYVNWWEGEEMNGTSKKTARQQAKKEIMEDLTVGSSQAYSKYVQA